MLQSCVETKNFLSHFSAGIAKLCRAAHQMWTAQLRIFFESTVRGKPRQLILVRWYEELPDDSRLRQLDKLVDTRASCAGSRLVAWSDYARQQHSQNITTVLTPLAAWVRC